MGRSGYGRPYYGGRHRLSGATPSTSVVWTKVPKATMPTWTKVDKPTHN